jgi:hypothetical protein
MKETSQDSPRKEAFPAGPLEAHLWKFTGPGMRSVGQDGKATVKPLVVWIAATELREAMACLEKRMSYFDIQKVKRIGLITMVSGTALE